jgi:hypothetical protein
MKVEHWTHKGVKPDGTFYESAGAVNTEPNVDVTWKGEGCDCGTCQNSDCYIRVNLGRDEEGTVRGMTIYFDSDKELAKFLKNNNFLNTHALVGAAYGEN